ncbi:hypothetical protein KC332_g10354 [Hortaea werneckii]|nr:hypothetical protein KC358_g13733 [Hortaea werneckii]KAI6808228.1 hypothetical protein KC350_g13418 [Hortaea werneckii]KAI6915930.1 hypothetical protein KC348_g11783 [Hortaea werneckii]KAI6939971.1 hypothetical protein KC341_g3829 [Hortaea werneckii]KAI6963292.1 hypothetical protein KC321_g11303 [Hortaea werneckii]
MEGVKTLERRLGFVHQLGTFKFTKQRDGNVLRLVTEIDRLTAKYWSTTESVIRHLDEFTSDVNAVFDELGHLIWPAGNRRSVEWLVEGRNGDKHYPRDLYSHDEVDQRKLRWIFRDLVIAKCRCARVTRLRQWGNERLCEPDESGEDGSEASHNTASDDASGGEPASDDDTSSDPDYQPFSRTSEPNPSPRYVNGRGHAHQHEPETPRIRSSRRFSRRHRQSSAQDEHNQGPRSWAVNSSVGTSSPLKRQRQPSAPTPATASTANMSRSITRRVVIFRVNPQKLSALIKGYHSDSTVPSKGNGTKIKNEIGPDRIAAASGITRKASRPEVLLEVKTTTSPVIDLTDETPESLEERVQYAARVATVPPTPVSLVQNLTATDSAGRQSLSQTLSVQPAASGLDTIAVATPCLGERIADSLGGVVPGNTFQTDANASEEQCNEPRSTIPEPYLPQQLVGLASNDHGEDLYSSTPPPPSVHSHDTTGPTTTAGILQPGTIGDNEQSREDDTSREQIGLQAEETKLRGAGGQLASPVSTEAESGHQSQAADESRQADLLSTMQQRARQLQAAKEQYPQEEESVSAREGQSQAQVDAMSRWIEREVAELSYAYQELERRSQTAARKTEAVEAMKRIMQASSSTYS